MLNGDLKMAQNFTDNAIMTTPETTRYVRLGKPTLDRFRLTGEGQVIAKLPNKSIH